MDLLMVDILDAIEDPIYILDNQGNFIFGNKALIELTGYTRREIETFNAFDLERKGTIDHSVTKTVLKIKKRVVSCQHVMQKNKIVNKLMITQTPIFEGNGDIKYLIGVLKNVQKINEMYRKTLLVKDVSVLRKKESEGLQGPLADIIAESEAMKNLLESASILASYDTTVLITGESGTGKEVIANFVHTVSPRAQKPMVKVNCASLPETLLETELFGYERGSFTGALEAGKTGLIECAHNGTLFLDEIDSLPLPLQGKLLRVLETKMIQKIGATKEKYVDFRLITATNGDLGRKVKEKTFRQDLYFRLNVVPMRVPPLRDRPEDIVPLARYFLEDYCTKYNKIKYFSNRVFEMMLAYEWPGNVRELKNFVERMVVMSLSSVIEIQDIPRGMLNTSGELELGLGKSAYDSTLAGSVPETSGTQDIDFSNTSYRALVDAYEERLIRSAMEQYGTTYRVAEMLGVNQSTISRKLNKFNRRK